MAGPTADDRSRRRVAARGATKNRWSAADRLFACSIERIRAVRSGDDEVLPASGLPGAVIRFRDGDVAGGAPAERARDHGWESPRVRPMRHVRPPHHSRTLLVQIVPRGRRSCNTLSKGRFKFLRLLPCNLHANCHRHGTRRKTWPASGAPAKVVLAPTLSP